MAKSDEQLQTETMGWWQSTPRFVGDHASAKQGQDDQIQAGRPKFDNHVGLKSSRRAKECRTKTPEPIMTTATSIAVDNNKAAAEAPNIG